MLKLVKISGAEGVAPTCPECKKACLICVEEVTLDMQKAGNRFRCPNCYECFAYQNKV